MKISKMKTDTTFKDDVLVFWNNIANNKKQPDKLKYLLHKDVCNFANILSEHDINEIKKETKNQKSREQDIYVSIPFFRQCNLEYLVDLIN